MHKENQLLSYDEFFYESWDYVSGDIVGDSYWEENMELIQDITFELYSLYRNTFQRVPTESGTQLLTTKVSGKLLEGIFDRIIKNGYVMKVS